MHDRLQQGNECHKRIEFLICPGEALYIASFWVPLLGERLQSFPSKGIIRIIGSSSVSELDRKATVARHWRDRSFRVVFERRWAEFTQGMTSNHSHHQKYRLSVIRCFLKQQDWTELTLVRSDSVANLIALQLNMSKSMLFDVFLHISCLDLQVKLLFSLYLHNTQTNPTAC